MRPHALLVVVALLSGACASVKFERDTQTSGTFRARGLSLTVLSWDIPKAAVDIARENVSDAGRPNTQVERVFVFPYLGPLDFLLDIVSVRYAKISGTWGFPGEPATASPATPGSSPGS